jgi:hypothetical protein
MKKFSTVGLVLSTIYIVFAAYLISSQGLFGESFIAIILGMPWTLALSLVEFGNASGSSLYILLIAPILLNTVLLYVIGSLFDGKKKK